MPGDSYLTVKSMQELVETSRRSWRLGATTFVAFGMLALVVAAVGVYGVIGYNVEQRWHELGVRVALGAKLRDVVRLVVGEGVVFALAGIAGGVLLALAASRWLQPLLFEQSARDPVVFGGVAVLMLMVALAASTGPAIRATRVNPTVALREE
jgi:ABC-type antimicrobial peptide transport system permease subunit